MIRLVQLSNDQVEQRKVFRLVKILFKLFICNNQHFNYKKFSKTIIFYVRASLIIVRHNTFNKIEKLRIKILYNKLSK